MRKHTLLTTLATVAAVALFTSCSNDENSLSEEQSRTGKLITITATQSTSADESAGNQPGTRLAHKDGTDTEDFSGTLGKGLTIQWAAPTQGAAHNDAFLLYGTNGGQTFTITGTPTDEGKKATFSGEDPGDVLAADDEYHAVYPAHQVKTTEGAPASWEECIFDMRGQIQKGATSTAHLSDYHYMTASGADYDALVFEHQVAILKFIVSLPSGKKPRMLTLCSAKTQSLVVSKAAGNDNATVTDYQLSMQLLDGEGEKADYSTFTAYMAVLGTTIPKNTAGFAVVITTIDNEAYSYAADVLEGGKTFAAGKVYDIQLGGEAPDAKPLEDITYKWRDYTVASDVLYCSSPLAAVSEGNPYLINNAADLKCFFNKSEYCANTSNEGVYYQLEHGVDIGTSSWTLRDFYGHFDGNDQTITGSVAGGFFQNIGTSAPSNHTVSNLITECRSSRMECGGICITNFGTIKDCRNTGAVSASGASSVAGGICTTNWGTIEDCENGGEIASGSNAGGICSTNHGTIKDCQNTGAVASTSFGNKAGGICATNQSAGKIYNSYNGTTSISFNTMGYKGSIAGNNSGIIYNCCGGVTDASLSPIGSGSGLASGPCPEGAGAHAHPRVIPN